MRALLDLAYQLDRGDELSADQCNFLAIALYRIGSGEDANHVFNVQGGRGHKLANVIARRRMSVILHWVACKVQPDPDSDEKVMSVSAACEEAISSIVPAAKDIFPGADDTAYDVEYILRCWTDPTNAHMRFPTRGWYDPDYPYYPLPAVKDPK